jgi:hypothetical protein
MLRYTKLSLILVMTVMLISGCQTADKLRWLDNQAGKLFNGGQLKNFNPGISSSSEQLLAGMKIKASELTKEQKEKIDKFLADNNLNRYGDASSTMYAGGTPLFNEVTGASVDRFDYILNKLPDIVEKIKN